MSARIAKIPQLPQDSIDDDDEAEENDSVGSLPGSSMGPPSTRKRAKRTPNASFAPISASTYFTTASQVAVPVTNLDVRVYYTPPTSPKGTVLVCHHGAGYSGLSFACFAKEVADQTKGECGVLSMDARRHGKTTSTSSSDDDLSVDVLTNDFVALVEVMFPDSKVAPSFVLVGHSMGGSVLTRACPLLLDKKYRVAGVAVLDVVEGTAVEALPHMHDLLNKRPDGFDSVEEAIEWHVNTRVILNETSARVSIPSIVVSNPAHSTSPSAPEYIWRTSLRSTSEYWPSWFKGLSGKFLAAKTARLLVLAGTERLDTELMIAQMQGKFQMQVVNNVGHLLHEDDPAHLAEILVDFWRRNERVIVGIKKVGDA